MIATNLIGPSRHASEISAMSEGQTVFRLRAHRFGQREGGLHAFVLVLVQTFGVVDQLNDLGRFLGLKNHAAVGHAHGMEGEVGNTRPRNHQVAAFLDEDDALEIEKFEHVAKVFLRGKGS